MTTSQSIETIAGISTAAGAGAIAVVRISGPESLRIADALFLGKRGPPSTWPANTFGYGHVTDEEKRILDEAIVLVMRAPKSFTREDVVEFQTHGGAVAARRVLQAVLNIGAKPAEPGEFTKRAFLNGRVDLVQAEAVMDMIFAASERAASSAADQLAGGLSKKIMMLYEDLMAAAADMEACLDFLEDELPSILIQGILERLDVLDRGFTAMLENWHEGRVIREGALAVISGEPNVGKSTLMNALLGIARAIVSPQPGTTRDFIEETIIINGFPIRLVDTAGLRSSNCEIEQQGIARTLCMIKRSDLHLKVIDATVYQKDEKKILQLIDDKKVMIVVNKKDILSDPTQNSTSSDSVIFISALNNDGISELKQKIAEKLCLSKASSQPTSVVSERHAQKINQALLSIREAMKILRISDESGYVLAAINLRKATEHIGNILGRIYDVDLLDTIFSRFCIGK